MPQTFEMLERLAADNRRALDDAHHEIAGLADEVAFWAFQAKWYYAASNGMGNYDDLPLARQKAIDAVFERHRRLENRERIGHVPDSYDIGS